MNIQVLSDIHLELRSPNSFDIPDIGADVVILAGDIGIGLQGIEWAAEQSQKLGKPCIYVPGNHEYYHHDLLEHDDVMRNEADRLGVIFLNEDILVMDGYTFLGATLWCSFRDETGDNWVAEYQAEQALADYQLIRYNGKPFRARHARERHVSAIEWLEEELRHCNREKTIVITHHAPSHRCANPMFPFTPVSRAFCSDAEALLPECSLWVYGHTHASLDTDICGTRVVSNQVCYPGESEDDFDPLKMITL